MYINLKIRNDVPLQVPADSCCNCGATEGVKPEATSLKHMPFMGLAGAEVTMPFTFPYCAQCRATAARRRPTLIGKVVLSAAIALGLVTAWFFLAGRFVDTIPIEYAATGLLLVALAVVFGAYALRRPSGNQTTPYQPVRLLKVSQKWPADVTGMMLGFSNKGYMRKFSAANQAVISKGILMVKAA